MLAETYGKPVSARDVFAYVAALTAHPAYIDRFRANLIQPRLRLPLTADATLFAEAVRIGGEVVWLHTFGERFAAPDQGRPAGAPRLPAGQGPLIPKDGALPSDAANMPTTIAYDAVKRRLHVGRGFIDNVAPEVWAYEVSGKQVLTQWFSYRGKDRSRPIIGDRRKPSPLGDIQPQGWMAEYTRDLLNILHVLGRLVLLEPAQRELLVNVLAGSQVAAEKVGEAITRASVQGVGQPQRARTKHDRQIDWIG